MKSGTTLLWKLLGSHPSVYMCTPKEPSYFVEPSQLSNIQPSLWRGGYWRSEARYLQLFQPNKNVLFAGEASVYYTALPHATGVAERISRFNPDARLIYIMRDPIERTISHYWHRVLCNDEDRSLLRAIAEDRLYLDLSYYAMQLVPYLDRFDRNQIRILTFEELIENHDEVIKSIFRWLGLDEAIQIPPVTPENVGPDLVQQRARWWNKVRRVSEKHTLLLNTYYKMPDAIRRYLFSELSSRQINRRNVNAQAVVRGLRPLQRRQTDELSELIGRDFPEWKTLNSAISERRIV